MIIRFNERFCQGDSAYYGILIFELFEHSIVSISHSSPPVRMAFIRNLRMRGFGLHVLGRGSNQWISAFEFLGYRS